MYKSLKLIGLFIATSSFSLIASSTFAANPNGANLDCTSNIVPAVIANGNWGECDTTPDSMTVKFYKLGLCTTKPTYNDYSACTFLFDNAAGKEVTLSTTLSDNLVDGEVSIPEGEYKYAMMVIANEIGVKKSFTFDNAIDAMNGTNGRYCRTNGNPKYEAPANTNQSTITCDNDATAQAVTSNQSFRGFYNDAFDNDPTVAPFVVGMYDEIASADAKFDIILMSSEGVLANVNLAFRYPNANPPEGPYPTGNATKIWGVQTFTNAKKIDANTKNVDMGFGTQDGMMFGFGGYCANGGNCLETFTVSKFEFKLSTQ